MLLDLRLAWRVLWRSPGFAVTGILILALGMGASTALFSIVDAVLFRPLPFDNPERLVRIWESQPAEGKERFETSAANFVDWRQRSTTLDDLALFNVVVEPRVLGISDDSIQAKQAMVTPNFFALLGVRPEIGREFGSLSEKAGPLDGTEVILSHALWERSFAADPQIIGRVLRIEGVPGNVVVGVMPSEFSFLRLISGHRSILTELGNRDVITECME